MSETTGFLSPVIDEQAQWLLKKHIDRIHQLEQQLQQARKEGWERCKEEAIKITFATNERNFYRCDKASRDAIAAMEYKEST